MKVSVEWLKDYSDIDVSMHDLSEILTMTGSKVEAIETKGEDIKNVVIGKILEIKKHPNADKLVVTKVNIGDEIVQIVTGAHNIKENDIVPIAKDGSELPGGVKINKGLLRGEESSGMMCSIGELNIGLDEFPNQIEDGIMILPKEYEQHIGKDVVDVLNLKEQIIEFEITPNRPDCLSVEGLGRETAVSLKKPYKNPLKDLEKMDAKKVDELEGLKVEIKDPDLCYRYIARVVKNVKIAPSPDWMKRRLKACGIRAINNIVDITNYIMLELGQPMHAFDINSIEGKQITVRRAKENEKITTLDDNERILDNNMLVIADKAKPVAIAGVMGGQNSEIEEQTTTVVFESAIFNGDSVRITAKNVGLRTEASSRYEKGLPQELAFKAIQRAVQLIEILNAGEVVEGIIDVYPNKQQENKIEFKPDRINALLGTSISEQEMRDILTSLDMKVEKDIVIPPYYRNDVEGEADLAEEVLRIYGYDKLGSTLVNAETVLGKRNKIQKMEDIAKQILVNNGFSETYNFAFMNTSDLEKCNIEPKEVISLINPLTEDYKIMRTSTVPSLMQVLETNNAKKNKNAKVFELGRTYKDKDGAIEKDELAEESKILTLASYGDDIDFYGLKGIIENLLHALNIKRYDVVRETENQTYHLGRCANIKIGKDVIITFGQVHPAVSKNYGINQASYLAEINLDKLSIYSRQDKKYEPIPKYPAVERDIAVILDEDIEAVQIERLIEKRARKVLESVDLFDVYRNEKIGTNKKSMAYALRFRSQDRTLTDDEINVIMEQIISDLEINLKAELRK